MISLKFRNKNNAQQFPPDGDQAEPIMDTNVKAKKKTPTWISDFRYGQSLSVEFFRKNAWLLILLLIVILSLMGIRYRTKTRMLEITRLERELNHVESEKLHEKAQYMSLIRESEMERLVRENGLGLQFQEQPPVYINQYESSNPQQ